MSRDLLKEAIADAKAVKETAIANAKAYLEEAFTPQLRSMLAAKLEEMDEETEEVKEMSDPDMRHGEDEDGEPETGALKQTEKDREITEEEELDLDEILDSLSEEDESRAERADVDKYEYEKGKEAGKADDEDEVGEITVDELRDIIRDVITDVMGGDMEDEGEEEIEMTSDTEEIEISEKKKDEMDEAKDDKDDMKEDNSQAELNEAIDVIKTLKSELNEVNLLNAKLLYVNKLFRNKTLTEAQKVKVINAFDRAESVKEVKNIFETIKDAITPVAKKPIQENRGFASKAAGVAPKAKQPIVEGDNFVARMQKLAGIIN